MFGERRQKLLCLFATGKKPLFMCFVHIYTKHLKTTVIASPIPSFHLDRYVPGCYAMSVSGDLPQDVIDSLQDKGVPYVSRDTSNRN